MRAARIQVGHITPANYTDYIRQNIIGKVPGYGTGTDAGRCWNWFCATKAGAQHAADCCNGSWAPHPQPHRAGAVSRICLRGVVCGLSGPGSWAAAIKKGGCALSRDAHRPA